MTVGKLLLGLFLQQISQLLELIVRGSHEQALDTTVASLQRQPVVAHEIGLLVGLQVFDQNEFEKPAGAWSFARVVMPYSDIVQVS